MRGRRTPEAHDSEAREGESFFRRFHRLKTEARQEALPSTPDLAPEAERAPLEPEAPPPGDEDMPPLETLDFGADFRGFLSPRVSEGLRKAALRKLFHSAELNVVDGLDEYAEDFTRFEALGDIVTADMRHQLELAARREAERLERELLTGEPEAEAQPRQPAEEPAPELREPELCRPDEAQTPQPRLSNTAPPATGPIPDTCETDDPTECLNSKAT